MPAAAISPASFYRINLRSSTKSPPRRLSLPLRSSSSPSPFAENEIALQLPDLKRLLSTLKSAQKSIAGGGGGMPGNVALVGTGPGDPELLTLKAVRTIERADLILYDRLVSNDVLKLVKGDARLLYVGKSAGYHSRTQEEIHELLLCFAEAGANVVRLKGGDPLVSFLYRASASKAG